MVKRYNNIKLSCTYTNTDNVVIKLWPLIITLHLNMLIKCQMPDTDVHYVIIITQARFTMCSIIAFYYSLSQIIWGWWEGGGDVGQWTHIIPHGHSQSLSQCDQSYYAQYYKSNAFN